MRTRPRPGKSWRTAVMLTCALCVAVLGTPTSYAAISPPSAPRSPSATPGNAQATVRWSAPANTNGSAITGYVVTPYAGSSALPSRQFSSSARSQIITGLTNGKAYTFKVAARNSGGTGPNSVATAAITVGTPTAPGSPVATAVNSSVSLHWQAPASSNAAPVNAYVANVYVGSVLQSSVLLSPSMTRQTITGLSNHVTYRFTVAANNSYGLSVASSKTSNVTPSLGASAGVEFECNSSSWSDAERQSVLDAMWNTGARWVRIPVNWSTVEPTAKKSYNFTLNDKCVHLATQRGFRVLQSLSSTPTWANGARGSSVPPANITDYGDIAQVLASRYNGTHGVGRVDAWEVWNEPNTAAWTGTAAQYVALVNTAYPRFHKGFVEAEVVVGAAAYNSSLFIRSLYDNGLTGAAFDVISVHPFQNPSDNPPDAADPAPGSYGLPADGYMTHTPTLASLLAAHGDGGKPIWWSAFGWSTCLGTTPGGTTSCVSEQAQADNIVGSVREAATYPSVGVTFVYTARDESSDTSSWSANRGLLRRNLTAKPALAALADYLLERTPHNGAVLWSASMEGGNLSEWSADGGGGMYDSGSSSASAVSGVAHSGVESLKATINTSTAEAGVRAFRWSEARANRDAYYSAWLYIPTTYNLSGSERWWNVFQFKSRNSADTRVDPLWGFYADQDAGGLYLHAGWGWGGTAVAGPYAGNGVSGKWIAPQTKMYLPVGRWIHLEAFLHQSKDFDGILRFWQDGTLLYDLSSIRTSYNNCNFNSWCADNEWSVNLYSDGMSPSPSTAYFDDALITR